MKKKLSLLFLFIFSIFAIHAQTICCNPANNLLDNGNFNTTNCATNLDFTANCVPNWSKVDGSPSLLGFNTNPFAWMWSVNGDGEALASRINFEQGVTYDICFRVRTGDRNSNDPNVANSATINLVATNNTNNFDVTATPSGQIIFKDTMGSYLGNWTNVSVQFTPDRDYERLWIFPFMSQPSLNLTSQAEMSIDDIIIVAHTNNAIDPNPLVMQDEYCQNDPLIPNYVPQNTLSYRWKISEITANGLVTVYTSLKIAGPAPQIDMRTIWNGFQVGKYYRLTLTYRDSCGNSYPYYHDFSIIEETSKYGDITLDCNQSFDINRIDLRDRCSGPILAIEDLITNTSFPPNAPLSFSQDALLKVTYPNCCILYLNVNIKKEKELVKEFCPSKDGKFLMEACGSGNGGYYDYYVNNTVIRTTDASMWVSYVAGNSYSVTYNSPEGCVCHVTYKLKEPTLQNVYATWCAGTTSFDLSTILDPDCQTDIDGFDIVNTATGQVYNSLILTDPAGGYDIFGNGGNGDLLCLRYSSYDGSCTKCIINITLRFYNGNCANLPVPVYCTAKRNAPQINADVKRFEEKDTNFSVYPNPSNGHYTIQLTQDATQKNNTFSMYVRDISGKIITKATAISVNDTYNLDISNYASGIYFLSVEFGTKKEVKKLIKN